MKSSDDYIGSIIHWWAPRWNYTRWLWLNGKFKLGPLHISYPTWTENLSKMEGNSRFPPISQQPNNPCETRVSGARTYGFSTFSSLTKLKPDREEKWHFEHCSCASKDLISFLYTNKEELCKLSAGPSMPDFNLIFRTNKHPLIENFQSKQKESISYFYISLLKSQNILVISTI